MARTKLENREYQRQRLQDPEKRRLHNEMMLRPRKALREWFRQLKSEMHCTDPNCPYPNVDPVCLDFHHRPGELKLANVTTLVNRAKPKQVILDEIAKCDVICSNCHRKRNDKLGILKGGRPAFHKRGRKPGTKPSQLTLAGIIPSCHRVVR